MCNAEKRSSFPYSTSESVAVTVFRIFPFSLSFYLHVYILCLSTYSFLHLSVMLYTVGGQYCKWICFWDLSYFTTISGKWYLSNEWFHAHVDSSYIMNTVQYHELDIRTTWVSLVQYVQVVWEIMVQSEGYKSLIAPEIRMQYIMWSCSKLIWNVYTMHYIKYGYDIWKDHFQN